MNDQVKPAPAENQAQIKRDKIFIQALYKFEQAAKELSEDYFHVSDEMNNLSSIEYPFAESFDEMHARIRDWTAHVSNNFHNK